MTLDDAVTAALLALAIFLAMCGTAFFLAGLLPGKSAPWWKQYGCAAMALTCAYYLFKLVFGTG